MYFLKLKKLAIHFTVKLYLFCQAYFIIQSFDRLFFMYFIFRIIFKLKYCWCTILYLIGVVFTIFKVCTPLIVINVGYIPRVVQYSLVTCFILESLYLLLLYPTFSLPTSFFPLVTTILFFLSVSLLLFCSVHQFAVFLDFYIEVILYSICLPLSDSFHLA